MNAAAYWIDACNLRNMRVVSDFSGAGYCGNIGTTGSGSQFAADLVCWGARLYSVTLKAPAKR